MIYPELHFETARAKLRTLNSKPLLLKSLSYEIEVFGFFLSTKTNVD